MTQSLNVIDNDNDSSKNINNVIDNVGSNYFKGRELDRRSDDLLKKLHLDDGSKGFMYKTVQKLSESRIQQHLETVTKPSKNGKKIDNPVGLFIYLCKRDGV